MTTDIHINSDSIVDRHNLEIVVYFLKEQRKKSKTHFQIKQIQNDGGIKKKVKVS